LSDVTTYYLEMKSIDEFNDQSKSNGLDVIEAEIKKFRLNKYLYMLVGEKWQWRDKLVFSDSQWKDHVENDQLRTWVAYYKGSIAGYFELETANDGSVEISYFGLAPKFIGRGFGGYLLSYAIKSAWQSCDAKRVWVHTCTLDHSNALDNYKARGFNIFREETFNK